MAPSATAEPESLNTTSGSAKNVIEFPKFEIVSPTKNFQKSDLSRSPHPSRMTSSFGRDHLCGSVRRVTRDAYAHLNRPAPAGGPPAGQGALFE